MALFSINLMRDDHTAVTLGFVVPDRVVGELEVLFEEPTDGDLALRSRLKRLGAIASRLELAAEPLREFRSEVRDDDLHVHKGEA